jgi:hypothetical protein
MDVEIPELELQHELQRFTSSFIERITQATEALQRSPRVEVREEAMRKNLLYASSAVEIATGPSASVNLLDMFVFVHLSRRVLEDHWIPTTYGESGTELDAAFTKAEQELGAIATRALSARGLAQLTNLADTWLADNPGQTRVEGIRLADFSGAAGTAAADRALQARGLLSSMKVATEAANKAMVIADRGMFLFHRLPFLLRLHVRLAVRDVVNDTMLRMKTGDEVAGAMRFARRTGYVALLGAATAAGLVWFRLRTHRRQCS